MTVLTPCLYYCNTLLEKLKHTFEEKSGGNFYLLLASLYIEFDLAQSAITLSSDTVFPPPQAFLGWPSLAFALAITTCPVSCALKSPLVRALPYANLQHLFFTVTSNLMHEQAKGKVCMLIYVYDVN